MAVDYQPGNERYRKALAQTENLAGVGRETRSEHIDNLVQQFEAQTAVLWAEIVQRIEEGQNALVEGDYNVAELAFQQAELRLDTLPYQHPGQAAKKREVQKFLAITKQRRKEDDLKRYQNQLQEAQDEKQELTQSSLAARARPRFTTCCNGRKKLVSVATMIAVFCSASRCCGKTVPTALPMD